MTQLSFALRVMSDRVNRGLAATMGDRIGMRPVVGYPKSGGTWLCGLLSAASGLPFAQLSRLPVVAPAVVQGHWRYSERFGGVAYIVRDGRDVMVSFYYHCRMQYHDRPSPTLRAWIRSLYGPRPDFSDTRANLPRFIEEMMRRPLGSKLSWPRFCDEWSDRKGVVYTRYEDLARDPFTEVGRICAHIGLPADAPAVRRSVEMNRMHRLTGRSPGEADPDAFVRKGIVGDWINEFSDESKDVFAQCAGETLVRLGYEQSSDWGTWSTHPRPGTMTPEQDE